MDPCMNEWHFDDRAFTVGEICPDCEQAGAPDEDRDDEPHGAPDREWSEIQQDRIDLYMNEF